MKFEDSKSFFPTALEMDRQIFCGVAKIILPTSAELDAPERTENPTPSSKSLIKNN